MIVRMWEARVRSGALDDLVDLIRRHWPALTATDGFGGGELYRADSGTEPRLVLLTRWRDEVALAAAAGPDWQTAAVPLPGEDRLHARPPHVWHFTPVPLPDVALPTDRQPNDPAGSDDRPTPLTGPFG